MPNSTDVTTFERICAGSLCQKLNRGRFALLELPTLLCRSEYQPGRTAQIASVRNRKNREPVVMVNRRDLEFNFCSLLHVNRRGRILIFLSRNLYDFCAAIACE